MRTIFAILALMIALPCAARDVDHGGRVDLFAAAINRAKGVHRIAGDCFSACTMWLGYRDSCVTQDARLWFHSAYALNTPNLPDDKGNALAMSYYPAPVLRIVQNWLRTTKFSSTHTLSGEQLIALGVVPQCR